MTIHEIARALMHDGKGIFIADESNESLAQLFSLQNISVDDASRAYRDVLFTAEGIERFLSGVVLSDEALSQSVSDGTPFYDALSSKEILVGALCDITSDISHLKEHVHALRSRAVSFSYLRIGTNVSDGPANAELKEKIRNAIECAKILQGENILPLIGVDVSTEGPHTAGQAEDTLVEALSLLSDALESSGLDLKGVIVATGMSATGLQNPLRAEANEVAERTVRALTSSLPEVLGGVSFLSGQDTPEKTTANLNSISRLEPFPWPITFSFSCTFHIPVLSVWKGSNENAANAQSAFLSRLSLAESADAAGYGKGMEDSNLI
jgi:fructose-bisphosphate aldolase class I